MPQTAWKPDPTIDSAARDVLAAYDTAVRRGKPPVECYQAAVDAWVRAHPDQAPHLCRTTSARRCTRSQSADAGVTAPHRARTRAPAVPRCQVAVGGVELVGCVDGAGGGRRATAGAPPRIERRQIKRRQYLLWLEKFLQHCRLGSFGSGLPFQRLEALYTYFETSAFRRSRKRWRTVASLIVR